MNVNQIYSLLNDINAQMFGDDAIDVHNLSGIISLGDTIVGDGTQTDLFLGKLVDRIVKTVIRTLDLELDFPGLFMNEFEFGAILQKITVNPFEAINNAEWQIGDENFTPTLLDIHKADVVVKYFKDATTWKFQVTIPDDMFATAFTSESMMSQFIDAIINALTDSMTIAINNMSRTAINNFMAEKIKNENGVINVLTEYNTLLGEGNEITADEAIHDKEFLRFLATYIRKYVKYLSQPNTQYNVDGIVRATARDNMHVLMLSEIVASLDAYLLSDSFKDLYDLPNFSEVAYWQGNAGTSTVDTFADVSSIAVIPSSEAGEESPTEVEQSGIVCALIDRQAVAVGLNKRRTANFYNPIDAYSNISSSATIQYINDLSENGVIFVVADAD